MTLNVQYFNSSSSGAPVLTGQNGKFVNGAGTGVMNWLCVTKGGWTAPFTSTNGAIFKPKAGNQYLLKCQHDSTVSGTAQLMTVRMFESATAFGTNVNPAPLVSQSADTTSNWVASSTADATVRPWYAIVADTFVAIFVQISATGCEFGFFGDCPKMISTDIYNTLLLYRNTTSPTVVQTGTNIGSGNYAKGVFIRSADGTVLSPLALVSSLALGQVTIGVNTAYDVYPPSFDSKWHRKKIVVGDIGNTTTTVTATKATINRGWLPNIWESLHNTYSGTTNADTWSDTAYNAGATFQSFGGSFTATTLATFIFLMEQTDTWIQPAV